MMSSNAPRRGALPPRPLRAPPRLAIRRSVEWKVEATRIVGRSLGRDADLPPPTNAPMRKIALLGAATALIVASV
jgi:hypothetical protein